MNFSGTSRFKPIRLLGTGGMGSVYLVYDKQLDAKVALKTLKVSSGLDLFRFKREFRSLADIRHVNLVTLYELVSDGDQWFFTMEYVVGVPFDRYALAQPFAPPNHERIVKAVQQLCAGVHTVHEAGCIHRDLKPTNVLVTEEGRVVILDFGLAKTADSVSLSGNGIFGTPAYMAPEQALEKPSLPASDWYAVGTMIYEALTGRCPFEGSLLEVLLRKQSEDPAAPKEINPLVDHRMSDLCMELIHRDSARRPQGSEILARLGVVLDKRTLGQTGRHPTVGSKGVRGRDLELQVLVRAFEAMRKGSPAVVMVQGTSGIGKTSLVDTFFEHRLPTSPLSAMPWILRGRCHEREALPFKAFDSVVDALTHHLAKLDDNDLSYVLPDGILHLSEIFPVLRTLKLITHERYLVPPLRDAKELRNQAFAAFNDLLVRMARLRPVIIFIDDLQWADLDSFSLLRALMRQPGAPALLLILNCRQVSDGNLGGAKALLREVEAQATVQVITLGPLSDESIRALADDLIERDQLGSAPELRQRFAQSIVGEARGNPFFAVEIVRHFAGLATPDDGLAVSPDGGDFHLDGMILKRVAALPEESHRLLEIVAVAGDPLPQLTLAGAIGVPFGSEMWERGISALVEERLISRTGRQGEDTVVTYHDRIREAVVRHLDAPALRGLHRQLAEAVEKWDHERTDRLARYWYSAEDHARAKRYASDAAQEARAKLAFDRAAEFYETAVALEAEPTARIELLTALGDCRASNGNASLAAEAYERAAVLSDRALSVRLHHLAAEQLLRGGQIAQGLEVLKDVLKQSDIKLATDPRRAFWSVAWRLLWLRLRGTEFVERPESSLAAEDRRMLDVLWSVNIGLGVVDILHADDFLLRFLMLALKTGDIHRVSQGLSMLAGQIAAIGKSHFGFSMKLLSKAEVLARRSSDPQAIGLNQMCKGVVHYFSGEWEAARNDLTSVEQYFLSHCHGVSWEIATTRIFASYALRMAGRLRELCERFDRYTADADRTGDRYLATNLRTYHSIVWLIRDDLPRASKDIEGLLDAWPGDRYQFQHFTHLFARCEQALYAGQPESALRALDADEPRILRSAMLKISGIRLEHAWLFARVALAMAERKSPAGRASFLRQARRNMRSLFRSDHQTGVAMAATIEAGVHWLSPGADRAVSVAKLDQAVSIAEASGAHLLAESGRRWLGEVVGGAVGKDLQDRSNRWMAEQGVQNPARLARVIVPGFQTGQVGS